MATIKYLLQSDTSTAPIYVRLSLGRGNTLKRKTGYVIDAKAWSNSSGYPKERTINHKNLKSDLGTLSAHIIVQYNNDNAKGTKIDGDWLTNVIESFHDRTEPEQKDFLTVYGDTYIAAMKSSSSSVKADTIGKYQTIVDKLKGFEDYKEKRYLLKDVGISFRNEFIKYLIEVEKISSNTAGRYISFVKTIILDARKNGYEISHQIADFRGYTVAAPIVTLSFDEIAIIKEAKLSNLKHEIARDWLIIGCYTGQRVGDLLRMNKGMITKVGRFNLITLKQQKTGSTVQIPIHMEVQQILDKRNGEFPPIFANTPDSNSAMFNLYIKDVCKGAKIDSPTIGNLKDPDSGVYGTGTYAKHLLVSSHICRRSFATNFYSQQQYPTPLLMSVTGHTTEKMFLVYIGKKPVDYAMQLAAIWEKLSPPKPKVKKSKKDDQILTP